MCMLAVVIFQVFSNQMGWDIVSWEFGLDLSPLGANLQELFS